LKRRIVHWKQRTPSPEALPAGPSPVPFQPSRPTPIVVIPSCAPPDMEELHVVDCALGGQRVHRNAELLRQEARELFTVNVIHPAGEAVANVSDFGQSGPAAGTPIDAPRASRVAKRKGIPLQGPQRAIFWLKRLRYYSLS
jgi:hypothetical protein